MTFPGAYKSPILTKIQLRVLESKVLTKELILYYVCWFKNWINQDDSNLVIDIVKLNQSEWPTSLAMIKHTALLFQANLGTNECELKNTLVDFKYEDWKIDDGEIEA